jgi:CheY-like chemotaxis protein
MRHVPELVLMDIRLRGPDDGLKTAAQIRRFSRSTAIIFVTAYADRVTLEALGDAEPDGFVLKPFDERSLDATVTAALMRRRAEAARLESGEAAAREHLEALLFERGPDAILAFDARGVLVAANAAAARLLGGAPGDLLGTSADRIFAHGDLFAAHSPLDVHGASSNVALRRFDGSVVAVDADTFVHRHHDLPVVAFRLRPRAASRPVANLARAASDEVARVADDIAVHAAAALAKMGSAHAARDDVERIAREADAAAELANVLDRIAEPSTIGVGPTDIAPIVSASDAHATADGELPARIATSAAEQLVRALVANAHRARPDQKPTLRARMVTLDAERSEPLGLASGAYVEIAVSDERAVLGAGEIAATFDDQRLRASAELAPLWLVEIVSLARAHGGAMDFESGMRGTTVRVYLPAA